MDLSFLTVQVLSALRQAAFLFLISSGLTLIFGVLNILNFAHGALYMLGAYFVYALTLHLTGPAGFLIAILAAPLGVALIATAIETGLLRRIYAQEEIYQLLLTYALVLIIDDLGMRKLPATAAEDLLELVMRRYERASTLLTSNRPVDDWGKLLGDTAAVAALLDRLLHHGHLLKCGPRSWRMRHHALPAEVPTR